VLDNCEHLIAACAKTAETLLQRCPKVHLIATSREPLGIGGETIYRVPSLSLPAAESDLAAAASCDAVALFAARARAQGVSLGLDADSIPLVCSVSAGRVRAPVAAHKGCYVSRKGIRSLAAAALSVRSVLVAYRLGAEARLSCLNWMRISWTRRAPGAAMRW